MCIYHGIYDEIFHQAEAAAEAVRAMGKEAGAKGWKSWGVSMWDPWELVGLFHFSDLFKLKVVVLPVTQMASDLQWLIGTGNLLPWRWLVAMEVMSYPQKRYKNKATNPRVLRRRSPVIIAMVIKYYNLVVMITHISKRYVINISAMEKTCFFWEVPHLHDFDGRCDGAGLGAFPSHRMVELDLVGFSWPFWPWFDPGNIKACISWIYIYMVGGFGRKMLVFQYYPIYYGKYDGISKVNHHLVGGLEHFDYFSISCMGCHPSHWLSLIFFKMFFSTTNQNNMSTSKPASARCSPQTAFFFLGFFLSSKVSWSRFRRETSFLSRKSDFEPYRNDVSTASLFFVGLDISFFPMDFEETGRNEKLIDDWISGFQADDSMATAAQRREVNFWSDQWWARPQWMIASGYDVYSLRTWKWPIEIVDLPIYPLNMVIFYSYVNVYQRVMYVNVMLVCWIWIWDSWKIVRFQISIHSQFLWPFRWWFPNANRHGGCAWLYYNKPRKGAEIGKFSFSNQTLLIGKSPNDNHLIIYRSRSITMTSLQHHWNDGDRGLLSPAEDFRMLNCYHSSRSLDIWNDGLPSGYD